MIPTLRDNLRLQNPGYVITYILTLCLLVGALITPVSAQAQDATLVSNIGQTNTATALSFGNDIAVGFVTGSNLNNYELSSVELSIGSAFGNGVTVSLWSATSGDAPDRKLFDFNNPANIETSNGSQTFTAPSNTVLTADTRYFIGVRAGDPPGNTSIRGLLFRTDSDNEDSGGLAGFTIDNSGFIRVNRAGNWRAPDPDDCCRFKFRLKGSIAPTVVTMTGVTETEIEEGDSVGINFTRTGDTTNPLTLKLFVDRSGVTFDPPITGLLDVTFPAGQSTVTYTLQTTDNETYSPESRGSIGAFIFEDPPGAEISGTNFVRVAVSDDDPPPVVTLELSPSTIDEAGGTSIVTATLDRPSSNNILVDISLEPGAPASLGSLQFLQILAGDTEVVQNLDSNGNPISPVAITATDNDVYAPEDAMVEVRGSVQNRGAIANPDLVTLTIADDDPGVVAIVRADP